MLNPLTYIFKIAVLLYRFLISPHMPPVCRFTPTCSAYALEALEKKNLWTALGLIISRLCRCHPIKILGGGEGDDPVPPGSKKQSSELF